MNEARLALLAFVICASGSTAAPFPDAIDHTLSQLKRAAGCENASGAKTPPGEADACLILTQLASADVPHLNPYLGAVHPGRSVLIERGAMTRETSRILLKRSQPERAPEATVGEGSGHSRELQDVINGSTPPAIDGDAWLPIEVHSTSLKSSTPEEEADLKAYLAAAQRGTPPPHNSLWEYLRQEARTDTRASRLFVTAGKSLGTFAGANGNILLFRQLDRRLLYVELQAQPGAWPTAQTFYVGEFFLVSQ